MTEVTSTRRCSGEKSDEVHLNQAVLSLTRNSDNRLKIRILRSQRRKIGHDGPLNELFNSTANYIAYVRYTRGPRTRVESSTQSKQTIHAGHSTSTRPLFATIVLILREKQPDFRKLIQKFDGDYERDSYLGRWTFD